MRKTKKYTHHIWYTRQGGEVKGPFPIGMVRRFVLLGRLHESDEVSPDKQEWRAVRNVPEVIPEEMQHVDSDEDRMRLMLTQLHEDERGQERRRHSGETPFLGRRVEDERRSPEMEELIGHREARNRAALEQARHRRQRNQWLSLLVVGGIVGAFVLGAYYSRQYTTSISELVQQDRQCDAAPAPGVNWSNCKLEGLVAEGADLKGARLDNADLHGADLHAALLQRARLAYAILSMADLRYSDLRNASMVGVTLRGADLSSANLGGADLSYANLQFANLAGARLEGAKLDKAIWVDGTMCAPGSVGACLSSIQK